MWLFAVCMAATLHASVLAWVILPAEVVEVEDDVDGSAMPIDLTAVAAASSPDIAAKTGNPNPEVAPQQANPTNVSVQPTPTEKNDLVTEQKSPTETDVTLPKPAPEKIESEADKSDDEKPTPPEPQQTVAVAEQEATAPPPAPTPPALVSVSLGVTPSERRSKAAWEKSLVIHLDKFKRYPNAARQQHSMGESLVEFSTDRTGAVLSCRLVKGSGSSVLDEEALAILARAAPLPAPPADVRGEHFELIVPIRFRLR